jgi:sporadic carbohydrate cluster 2OG-Fe(II) oxygenase
MLARAGASTSEELYRSVEKDLVWLDIKYGEVLVFNQNLPHGNRINRESQSRWSFNCRFKGVFTPYADKRLGEFFEPITLRPVSRVGMDYRISEDHETRNRGDRDGRL